MRSKEASAVLLIMIAYVIGLLCHRQPELQFLVPYSADIIHICGGLMVLYFVYKKNTRKPFLPTVTGLYGLSFVTEMFGLQTGMVFGEYEYLDGFLLKFQEVPVAMGLQWVTLAMSATSVAQLFSKTWKMPLLAAGMMTGFDVLMEPGASIMNYWNFADGVVPYQNYAGWFGLSFVLSAILKWTGLSLNSLILRFYIVVQIAYFLGISWV